MKKCSFYRLSFAEKNSSKQLKVKFKFQISPNWQTAPSTAETFERVSPTKFVLIDQTF
jgi:hypothetical protein